jgi:hypothetical protein
LKGPQQTTTRPGRDRSEVVVEQCTDENTGARPGIALVEQTFSLE